jgi:Ala-tRNA(Pro) deacylase
MTVPKKIREYLDKEKVGYQLLEHGRAFTATEVAGAQHVPGRQMVKSVIVKADDQFLMCLLPAIHLLDLEKLKAAIGAKLVRLAQEEEMSKLFPDCEIGSEPPFGTLYGLKVYADKFLEEENEVAFNAGTHTDMIKMKFKDVQRLSQPTFIEMGIHI